MRAPCSCTLFIRSVMQALGVDELEKKHPEMSDMDLALGEIERLKQADAANTKAIARLLKTS